MNYWILSASGLSALLFFAHIMGGGKDVHKPMLESDMSRLLKAYTSVIWHAISAILGIGSAVLFVAAIGHGDGMAIVIALQYLAFVGLFLACGVIRLKSIWTMPQWSAFLLISILIGAGLWR